MCELRAVAFDCDGVLVDSEIVAARVLTKHLVQTADTILDEVASLAIIRGRKLSVWIEELTEQFGAEVFDAGFEEQFRREVDAAYERDLQAVAGIQGVLDLVPIDKRVVVSNAPAWKISRGLELTGLSGQFVHEAVSGYDLGAWKPDPAPYRAAAFRLGLRPTQVLALEDSVAGVESAVLAGLHVVLYDPDSVVTPAIRRCFAPAETVATMGAAAAILKGALA